MKFSRSEKRIDRHQRVRAKVSGTAERPRLAIFRSNNHVWAQLIDDEKSITVAMASDIELGKGAKGKKTELAGKVGELIAKKAADKKINIAIFDRGGYRYHGMVKNLAEGARKGGLKF